MVMPPPTFRCCATESEGEFVLLATLFRRSMDEDLSRSSEAERSRSSDADLSLPADVFESRSMESISSFT